MPRRSSEEIQFLVESLVDAIRSSAEDGRALAPTGGGLTRLGKLELMSHQPKSVQGATSADWIRDCALLRIRQNKYSCVAILDASRSSTTEIGIFAEHESGLALVYRLPFRQKRPRVVTFGELRRETAKPRLFRKAG